MNYNLQLMTVAEYARQKKVTPQAIYKARGATVTMIDINGILLVDLENSFFERKRNKK